MKIDWARKLSSRKFWALLAAMAVALLSALGAGEDTAQRIVGVVSAVGACAMYMLAEARADAGGARNKSALPGTLMHSESYFPDAGETDGLGRMERGESGGGDGDKV